MDVGTDPPELNATHPLLSLIAAVFWAILWLLSWAKSLIAFATITVPRIIYSILSYSLTFTLNFWSFVVIFVASAVALNYFIRFRYLEVYQTLKEPPLVKSDAKELHPDVNTTDAPPNFHNYLDDFLEAVRIFGFLEKPVFHELARHLQTRRLIAGDSISLDQDKNFYCVVDGLVQVYTKTGDAQAEEGAWGEGSKNGYQLLNEVGSGGTLSSLFTILSLFTEDVRISWNDGEDIHEGDASNIDRMPSQEQRAGLYRSDSNISNIELSPGSTASTSHSRRNSSISSAGSTILGSDTASYYSSRTRTQESHRASTSDHARLPEDSAVALAVEDATLAVIPAEAFQRLVKQFPKASAHIVQVILTRFSRVTINAAHKYLGLTTEVIRAEEAINRIACHPLPPSFYEGGGLQHLRHRFDRQSGGDSPPEYFDFDRTNDSGHRMMDEPVFTESPIIQAQGQGLSGSSRESLGLPAHGASGSSRETMSFNRMNSSRFAVQAGDLLTTAGFNDPLRGIHRMYSTIGPGARPGRSQLLSPSALFENGYRLGSDEFDLKEEVMSCIAKSIGLHQPPMSESETGEASPMFQAVGSRSGDGRSPNTFTSFGSLSLLETADDASTATGESTAVSSTGLGILDNEVEILYFAGGTTLTRVGERHPGLFYVIDGILDVSLPLDKDPAKVSTEKTEEARVPKTPRAETPVIRKGLGISGLGRRQSGASGSRPSQNTTTAQAEKRKHLFTVKPGGIAGYMASLCGIPSYVEITAKTDSYVGFLPFDALERLLEKRPIVLLTLAKRLISLLSPLVLHIDASLDWMQVSGGKVLWRPGDPSDSFYIVINGRLRAIDDEEEGKVKILAEYGQGDPVGELDVITRTPRRNTVHAIRDTELVRMPLTLFNAISSRNPQATAELLRIIASRVREEVDSSSGRSTISRTELGLNNLNLKTIAIMPTSRSIPIEAFAKKLQSALVDIGAPTELLNQASIGRSLGRHAFTRMGKLKVAGFLADQEQRFRTVLYVVDSPVNSTWTQTCIRQADCVMVVGAGGDPSIGEYERMLMSVKTTARKELVLLHPERSVVPGSTREWLKVRPWVSRHFHVELPGINFPEVAKHISKDPDPAAVAALKNLKDRVQNEIQKFRGSRAVPQPQRPPHMSDFARLARRICGKSIGLVLGGGGARGLAHLGVIQALIEAEIPIDMIGGTSIGAFVGGLYAREGDMLTSAARTKQFCARMGNIWRLLSDLTYPIVAYTTGFEFNRAIYKSFYDLHIEDMWLPFFCNSTNILSSDMETHESGYAWRYIRASMTLVGLVPPLCDNGSMLVDGGYMDNLPVSSALSMGASCVFAIDVASVYDNSPRNFGDTVSGIWLLLNRLNPFANSKIPPITEIQSRLAYVSSVKTLEEAKKARDCFYMQMPVQDYGIMQFNKYDEIRNKGYGAAMKMLQEWEESGRFSEILQDLKEEGGRKKMKRGKSARRNSI